MTAIAQQGKWILSQGRLESEGCSFMYSLQGSSYMITPYGDRLRLGRDRERMPLLRGRYTTPGSFVVCDPESTDAAVVGLLIDTGATTQVAGGRWDTRLNLVPGVSMSARTVGGGAYRRAWGAVYSSWTCAWVHRLLPAPWTTASTGCPTLVRSSRGGTRKPGFQPPALARFTANRSRIPRLCETTSGGRTTLTPTPFATIPVRPAHPVQVS